MTEGLDYFNLSKSVAVIYRSIQRFMNAELKAFNLNSAEQPILNILYHESRGLTQEEIARLRGCDKSAITKTIRSLDKKGYITIMKNPDDHRKNSITTTEKAMEIKLQIYEIQNKCEKFLAQDLDVNIYGLTRSTMEYIAKKHMNMKG